MPQAEWWPQSISTKAPQRRRSLLRSRSLETRFQSCPPRLACKPSMPQAKAPQEPLPQFAAGMPSVFSCLPHSSKHPVEINPGEHRTRAPKHHPSNARLHVLVSDAPLLNAFWLPSLSAAAAPALDWGPCPCRSRDPYHGGHSPGHGGQMRLHLGSGPNFRIIYLPVTGPQTALRCHGVLLDFYPSPLPKSGVVESQNPM